jgi:hypothetical protein
VARPGDDDVENAAVLAVPHGLDVGWGMEFDDVHGPSLENGADCALTVA